MDTQEKKPVHIPVLLQEVIHYLQPQAGEIVFDGTYGAGGYSNAIASLLGKEGKVIACDQDPTVVKSAKTEANVSLFHANFSDVKKVLEEANVKELNAAVLDLGISSDQLADKNRGISFANPEAPLDMRMNVSEDNNLTAYGILHAYSEEEIANLLWKYSDESFSRKIAEVISRKKLQGEMDTVGDLVSAVEEVVWRKGKMHPATKTFQALRIAVNNELGSLELFLNEVKEVMASEGRVVIVSFHSAEDRIVKNIFREWKKDGLGTIETKKPLKATKEEVKLNTRSRSALLRAFTFY